MHLWRAVGVLSLFAVGCVQLWGVDELHFAAPEDGGASVLGGGGAGAGEAGAGEAGAVAAGGEAAGGHGTACGDGSVCIPPAPTSSLVALLEGASSCGAWWAGPTTFAAPTQLGCEPCTCAPPPTGTCSAQLGGFDDMYCDAQENVFSVQGCFGHSSSAFQILLSVASVQECEPSEGEPTPLVGLLLCTEPVLGPGVCEGGDLCVTRPASAAQLCYLASANEGCAPGYSAAQLVAEVQSDGRQCTCTCLPSTGQQCSVSAVAYENPSCLGQAYPIDTLGTCTNTPNTADSVLLDPGDWSGGSCAPQTGVSGSIAFGATRLLCCVS